MESLYKFNSNTDNTHIASKRIFVYNICLIRITDTVTGWYGAPKTLALNKNDQLFQGIWIPLKLKMHELIYAFATPEFCNLSSNITLKEPKTLLKVTSSWDVCSRFFMSSVMPYVWKPCEKKTQQWRLTCFATGLLLSLKRSPDTSKRIKQGKTLIPPETMELEIKERQNAYVLTVLYRT